MVIEKTKGGNAFFVCRYLNILNVIDKSIYTSKLKCYYVYVPNKRRMEMEKEKRTMAWNIKATPTEIAIVKKNADEAGLPVSTYIRWVAMKGNEALKGGVK